MSSAKWKQFELEKQRIAQQKLSAAEYEKAIKELCRKYRL